MKLHTLYHDSGPSGFKQEVFICFPIKAYVKHMTPGWAVFGTQDYNFNNLGRNILGDVTYQVSRL